MRFKQVDIDGQMGEKNVGKIGEGVGEERRVYIEKKRGKQRNQTIRKWIGLRSGRGVRTWWFQEPRDTALGWREGEGREACKQWKTQGFLTSRIQYSWVLILKRVSNSCESNKSKGLTIQLKYRQDFAIHVGTGIMWPTGCQETPTSWLFLDLILYGTWPWCLN